MNVYNLLLVLQSWDLFAGIAPYQYLLKENFKFSNFHLQNWNIRQDWKH